VRLLDGLVWLLPRRGGRAHEYHRKQQAYFAETPAPDFSATDKNLFE